MVSKGLYRGFSRSGAAAGVLMILLAVVVILCSALMQYSCSPARSSRVDVSKGAPERPPAGSDIVSDPDLVTGMLPNGFRYTMMKNREPKDRVSMHLLVQVGSFHETVDQRGVAHFLEHMMFNGSKNYPPGELIKYFQLIGMQFGPDANAHTGFQETVYDILLPGGDTESIEEGLLVLKDYAQGALLLQEEIDRERGVILSEKRSRDSADYRTYVEELKFEFPDARFTHRLPIGEETVIRTVDHESMRQFYDTWYRPERMVLIIVGEFDVPGAERLVRAEFGDMTARGAVMSGIDFGEVHHEGLKTFYHHEAELGATSVAIEVARKTETRTDSAQLRREDLVIDMAGWMLQNRLEEMVSAPDAPFTSAVIYMGRFMQQVEYGEISADCRPENWKKALSRIEQTLRQALAFGFTGNELERVKKEMVSYLENAVVQAATRESGDLASEIIWHINNNRTFLSPGQENSLLKPIISEVTLDDVHAALQKAWPPDHRLVLVTGNASLESSDGRNPEKEIQSVYELSATAQVEAREDSAPSAFPYLLKPQSPGEIRRMEMVEDLDLVQVDFENGVRLNLKKTDFEAGKIRSSIVFGDGKSAEPLDCPGLAILSEAVVNESGLGRLDKNELAYALAGSQVKTAFEIEEDRFVYRGTCASQELELLVQALYAHVMDPGFRQDAFGLVMERVEQTCEALVRDIDGAMTLEGRRFLAGGDSRFGIPPLDSLKSLTLEDVRTWIGASRKNCVLEVNLVGDMDVEGAIDLVCEYFGAIPGGVAPSGEIQRRPVAFPAGKTLDVQVDTQIPKGLVVVAYPTDDYWDISRTRRISVLGDIFSEKLRERIREELGASYSPFAYNAPSRAHGGYGVLQAYVYVAPEQADLVVKAVREISGSIVQKGVSAEDLERSLKPILTSIKDYRRTNTYWLDSVMSDCLRHPQQLDWSRTFEADYASITVEDIKKMAETYLVDERAACITIVPVGKK